MANLQDTDLFLVNSNDNTYQIDAAQLMAKTTALNDDDLFLVNRNDETYTIPWGDFKGDLATDPDNSGIARPQIIEPANFSGITERVKLEPITRVTTSGTNYMDYVTGSTIAGSTSEAISGYDRSGNIFDSNRYNGSNVEPIADPIDGNLFRTFAYGSMRMRFYDPSDLDPTTGLPNVNADAALGLEVQNKLVIQFFQPANQLGDPGKFRINTEAERSLTERGVLTPEQHLAANRIEWTGPLRLKTLDLTTLADLGAGVVSIWVDGAYLRNDADLTVSLNLAGNRNFKYLNQGTDLYILDSSASGIATSLEVVSVSTVSSQLTCTRLTGRLPVVSDVLVGAPITPGPAVDPANAFFRSTDFSSDNSEFTHVSSDWLIYEGDTTQTVILNSEDTDNKTTWTATGLAFDTLYKAQVRYRAENNVLSAWSEPVTFRTQQQSFATDAVFNVSKYTGTGTTQNVTTNAAADLIWIFGNNANYMFDTQRGPNRGLEVSTTSPEDVMPDSVTDFTPTGFTLGSSLDVNQAGQEYTVFSWGAGGERLVNTNGSVQSETKTSQQGFSIVTWTGTGNNIDDPDGNGIGDQYISIGHGLNQAPDLVIVKKLDRSSDFDYFASNAQQSWGQPPPTIPRSKVLNDSLRIGGYIFKRNPDEQCIYINATNGVTSTEWNRLDDTYIAYCWVFAPQYGSASGRYEGQGGLYRSYYCGFKPELIFVSQFNPGNPTASHGARPGNLFFNYLDLDLNAIPDPDDWRTQPELLEQFPEAKTEGGINLCWNTDQTAAQGRLSTPPTQPVYPYGSNWVGREGLTWYAASEDQRVYTHGGDYFWFAWTSQRSSTATTGVGAESLILDAAANTSN